MNTAKTSDAQEPKIGVYICHCGGNISDVVDIKKVVEEVGKLPGVVLSVDYEFMCSDPGQQKIKAAIKEGKINRVVVAACSFRLHEMTFRRSLVSAGLNQYLLEQANIREQVSWVHKLDHDGATQKAIKLTRMAVEKVKLAKPLDMIEIKSLPEAVIVGAGPAGLRAALDLAQRGSTVHLVEKTPFAGGNAAKLGKLFPTDEEAKDIVAKLTARVEGNNKIILHTNAQVEDAEGGIGNFKTKIKVIGRGVLPGVTKEEYIKANAACPVEVLDPFTNNTSKRKAIYMDYDTQYPPIPAIDWAACTLCAKCKAPLGGKVNLIKSEEVIELEAGAMLIATGYNHYEPFEGEYGYKTSPNIITLPALMSLIQGGMRDGKDFIFEGKKVKSIGFMHCVGSREQDGVKKAPEERRIFAHCSRLCCTAILQAANEIKEKFPKTDIYSFFQDIRTYGRDCEVKYYDKASKNGVIFMRYDGKELPEVTVSQNKVSVKLKDLLTMKEELEAQVDLLVLATGMHPAEPGQAADKFKMPKSNDRFLQEVHPKLRPVETAIGGIFLAGTSQAPMDMTETSAGASTAAIKAAAILEGGNVQLEPYIAKVDREKCKGHGNCVKACPAKGAIYIDKDGKASVNPMLCISCGNCVAVCPERACDINGYEIKQFEAMIDAIVKE